MRRVLGVLFAALFFATAAVAKLHKTHHHSKHEALHHSKHEAHHHSKHKGHRHGKQKGHHHGEYKGHRKIMFKDPVELKGHRKTIWEKLMSGEHDIELVLGGVAEVDINWGSIGVVSDAIYSANETSCANPEVRVNWKTLSDAQRTAFIAAIKCMAGKPSRTGLVQGTTLYDDYASVHIVQAYTAKPVHSTAQFLVWHRYFLYSWITDVRACGYTDNIPYWNWTEDADTDSVSNSTIFDANTGFGGNGKTQANGEPGPVVAGPFANWQVNVSDGIGRPVRAPHALARQFNQNADSDEVGNMRAPYYNSAVIASLMRFTTYDEFRTALEDGPHSAVHRSIGGDMAGQQGPSDPLFFMHHCNIDRLWASWQSQDPSRLKDYSGPTSADDDTNDAQIADKLDLNGLQPTLTVADVLNTQGDTLCYKYDA